MSSSHEQVTMIRSNEDVVVEVCDASSAQVQEIPIDIHYHIKDEPLEGFWRKKWEEEKQIDKWNENSFQNRLQECMFVLDWRDKEFPVAIEFKII